MDYESWHVDIEAAVVRHPSGFRIAFEGAPTDPNDISPSGFPAGLSASEQARLLRCGMQALAKAAKAVRRSPSSGNAAANAYSTKKAAATKASFKNKSSRPVLSLKR